jgi:Glycosyltransferase family 87
MKATGMTKHLSFLALVAALVLTVVLVNWHFRRLYGAGWLLSDGSSAPAGTVDYLAYWRAFQAVKRGLNPYDPASLRQVQDLTLSFGETQQYWNPPWMLVLMAPVLSLPFKLSALLWMYLSILFLCAASLLVWKSQNGGRNSLYPCLIAGLCFYPLWETLFWGQIGALVTLGVAGFLWAVRNKRDILAGVFLIPVSLKPHLLYLFLLAVGFWVVAERRYRALASFAAGIGILCGLLWIRSPSLFENWLKNSSRSWKHIEGFRSANFVGFARALMVDFTGRAPVWLILLIPAATAAGFVVWLAFRKRIEWENDLAPILCASVVTAPYGWLHDHLVLSIIQTMAVAWAFEKMDSVALRTMVCLDWGAFQALVLGLSFSFMPFFQFFWFPMGVLLLWMRSLARLRNANSDSKCTTSSRVT